MFLFSIIIEAITPAGVIASMMMEKRNTLSLLLNLLMIKLGFGSSRLFASDLSHAYEAPYPNARFKMAVRAMPSQVPMIPDQSLEAQLKAWEFFSRFEKPFLCIGAGNDPVTNGFEKQFIKRVPRHSFNKLLFKSIRYRIIPCTNT